MVAYKCLELQFQDTFTDGAQEFIQVWTHEYTGIYTLKGGGGKSQDKTVGYSQNQSPGMKYTDVFAYLSL